MMNSFAKAVGITFVVVVMIGCGGKGTCHTATLEATIDSLRVELLQNQQWLSAIRQVGILMDSIDAGRRLLRVNVVGEEAYMHYVARMESIKDYVTTNRHHIVMLEREIGLSKSLSRSVSAMTKALHSDLEEKMATIQFLQQQVQTYENENGQLGQLARLKEKEIEDKNRELVDKQQELSLVKEEVELLTNQRMSWQASTYYAKGEMIEEVARRIKFAPRKKRDAYMRALGMYRKALSMGSPSAIIKIALLEKKLVKTTMFSHD